MSSLVLTEGWRRPQYAHCKSLRWEDDLGGVGINLLQVRGGHAAAVVDDPVGQSTFALN